MPTAWDPVAQKEAWRVKHDHVWNGGTLATAGGVVFQGTPGGEFVALDAQTGEKLWEFQCGSGHHSSPSTYSVDGRQFVVVPTGWGGWVEGFLPGLLGNGAGDSIFVFALPVE